MKKYILSLIVSVFIALISTYLGNNLSYAIPSTKCTPDIRCSPEQCAVIRDLRDEVCAEYDACVEGPQSPPYTSCDDEEQGCENMSNWYNSSCGAQQAE